MILAEKESFDDWWLPDNDNHEANDIVLGGAPTGAPSTPPPSRGVIIARPARAGAPEETLRNSRAVRLARLSERTIIQSTRYPS